MMGYRIFSTIVVLLAFNAGVVYNQQDMIFQGVRYLVWYVKYTNFPEPFGDRCCSLTCRGDYNMEFRSSFEKSDTQSERQNTVPYEYGNQTKIHLTQAIDIDPSKLDADDFYLHAKFKCAYTDQVHETWVIPKVEFYSYFGTFAILLKGQTQKMQISFAVKGNCPGRAGKGCKKTCYEDEIMYCDEISGIEFCKNKRFGSKCEFQFAVCNENPCYNGLCENVGAGFKCHCFEGFFGETCKHVRCTKSECSHGICANEKFCNCEDGYSDISCSDLQLSASYCNGRGKAVHTTDKSSYTCECYDDSTGRNCEFSCNGICQNGGKCVVRRNIGFCRCLQDYTGVNCEFSLAGGGAGVCEKINCQNGGNCVKVGIQDFKCECTELWYGSFCTDSYCHTNYCYHGNCIENYGCICFDGYSGKRCENIDVQTFSECQNGGKKSADLGFLRCVCEEKELTGEFCEYKCLKRCINGVCDRRDSVIKCLCDSGYTGDDCSESIVASICDSHPCENGGVCKDLDGSMFECKCNDYWSGVRCEKSSCKNNFCLKGTCMDGIGCLCFKGYNGTECNSPICPTDNSFCDKPEQCITLGSKLSCKCDRKKYYGSRCEHTCNLECSENGFCDLINGNLQCTCFANYKGKTCSELIDYSKYLYTIYACAFAIIFLLIISSILILYTMRHKLIYTAQATRNAMFDASNILGFKRRPKVLQVDDTYGTAMQKNWAISSR